MRVLLIAILSLFAWQSFAQLTVSDSLRREGFLASQKRDYSIAIRNYEAILSRDSLDYDATLAAARLSVRLKDYDQGRYYFAEILRRDSSDWEAWNGLGSLFLEEGKMEAALQYYQRGVEILPGYVPGYLDLAKALSYDGQLKEAILIYRAANRIDSPGRKYGPGSAGCTIGMPGRPQLVSITAKPCLSIRKTGSSGKSSGKCSRNWNGK
jgi:tetratricopeptide (TPR) repeat protein